MILPPSDITNGSTLSADVCIVGAGPAGISLALRLEELGIANILLVESGQRGPSAEGQALLDSEIDAESLGRISHLQRRQFGGTTGAWNTRFGSKVGAKYVPLDEADFKPREWLPGSGWPIGYAEMLPFYQQAQRFCGLGHFDYSADAWTTSDFKPYTFTTSVLTSGVYQLGRHEVFQDDAWRNIHASTAIRLLTECTAVELITTRGEYIDRVLFRAAAKSFAVQASRVVLAAGSIENARLLLVSRQGDAVGVGNASGQVGRQLMDHPAHYCLEIIPVSADLIAQSAFYGLQRRGDEAVIGRLGISDAVREREELLNLSIALHPKIKGHRSPGMEAMRTFRGTQAGDFNYRSRLRAAVEMARRAMDVIGFGYHYLRYGLHREPLDWSLDPRESRYFGSFEPELYVEQSPHPDNRVTLSARRDAYGVPLPKIVWRWMPEDQQRLERAISLIAAEFERSGIGTVRRLAHPRMVASSHHLMGTTRMSIDARNGVVDANCRVHGVENLYVNGPSVFPTGGFANPTLTIVAMSYRLAGHLANRLTRAS